MIRDRGPEGTSRSHTCRIHTLLLALQLQQTSFVLDRWSHPLQATVLAPVSLWVQSHDGVLDPVTAVLIWAVLIWAMMIRASDSKLDSSIKL